MSKMLAVHFLTANMTPYVGRGKPWKVGQKRSVPGELRLCRRGFHYCPTWKDAFLGGYLYGTRACVVEVDDDGPKDNRKGCSRSRKLVHVSAIPVDLYRKYKRAERTNFHAASFAAAMGRLTGYWDEEAAQ